jgi:hypothetical protein
MYEQKYGKGGRSNSTPSCLANHVFALVFNKFFAKEAGDTDGSAKSDFFTLLLRRIDTKMRCVAGRSRCSLHVHKTLIH